MTWTIENEEDFQRRRESRRAEELRNYQFFEDIQNAIALEIRDGGQVEGDDLATAAKMAIAAFCRLQSRERDSLSDYAEDAFLPYGLEAVPEWCDKYICAGE